MKRWVGLLLALMLSFSQATAMVSWPSDAKMTKGQQELEAYVTRLDDILIANGEKPVNQLFELYSSFATMAITASELADVPDDVEISFTLDAESICTMTLHVADIHRFPVLAAACIQAAKPALNWQDVLTEPSMYAKRVEKDPSSSFENPVSELKSTYLQTFYTYTPNEYSDNVNWISLTLVFPLAGYEENGVQVTYTPAPQTGPGSDGNPAYEGFVVGDGLVHYEIFTTETPSPEDGLIRP